MRGRPANQFTRHVITNFHFVEVTETRARATLYNLSWFSFEAENLPVAFVPENALLLDFHDTYSLPADGCRFSERLTSSIFQASRLIILCHLSTIPSFYIYFSLITFSPLSPISLFLLFCLFF